VWKDVEFHSEEWMDSPKEKNEEAVIGMMTMIIVSVSVSVSVFVSVLVFVIVMRVGMIL
jgi:hypothetical protein